MRFASHDEMEDAIRDEYQEKINQLEEEAVELLKEIDALKHEVDVAEAEADIAYQEAQNHRETIVTCRKFTEWVQENYPDIITTYQVINRLEGTT
jgi:uncharacterized coiled-coil DUF342 family protein